MESLDSVMRLLLVRHAATSATRTFSFPADESLDAHGVAAAASLAARLPSRCAVLSSPARRCLETAAAAGFAAPVCHPAIAECDFGTWAGRSLADVHETDAAEAVAWMTQPSSCPHDGRWTLTRVNCLAEGRPGDPRGEGAATAHGARS